MKMDKGKRWEAVRAWADQVTDKLGMPLDPGIVDTVILLNLFGIKTISSCEGHLDYDLSPNIMFLDPKADEMEQEFRQIQDHTDPEYTRLYREAARLNYKQKQLLIPMLDEFYHDRIVPFTNRLVLMHMRADGGLLMCHGVTTDAKMTIPDVSARRRILTANQAEMRAFTEFLSQKYFLEDGKGAPHTVDAPFRPVTS